MSIPNDAKNDFDYALTEDEAKWRFNHWQSVDPFPQIFPSLLNSADIADYVFVTGMIWPFYRCQLKSAAYEMQLGREFLYWDDKGEEIHSVIDESTTICLKKNSITYVTLKESFLLPDYMALRFNLTINHVHRGLLLGTGPLVNPGFQGKLMVPIHNLTPNEYPLRPGDPLISVEFTKLSPITDWAKDRVIINRPVQKGQYIPKHKTGISFKEYLEKALPHGTTKVESSLSHALDAANNEIREFRKQATDDINTIKESAEKEIKKAGVYRTIVTVGTLLAVGALAWMTWQIFQSNSEFTSQAIDKKNEIYASLAVQKDHLDRLGEELRQIKDSNVHYSQNKVLQSKIEALEYEMKRLAINIDSARSDLKVLK